jgi:ubiquinone/menaquinone biosynthesis C-methylase UbiE
MSVVHTFLKDVPMQAGVYTLSGAGNAFEPAYLQLRTKEKWLLTDAEVKQLPYVDRSDAHYTLWKMRANSAARFTKYLAEKNQPLAILDIGCGNGWLTNYVAAHVPNSTVTGVDINLTELQQAARVFGNHINWVQADILQTDFMKGCFDVVLMSASFQYFDDTDKLIKRLLQFLKPGGEVHILDTPFYTTAEAQQAKQRSKAYFSSMQSDTMQQYYHHHTLQQLSAYRYSVLYTPNRVVAALGKLVGYYPSPFKWVCIKK